MNIPSSIKFIHLRSVTPDGVVLPNGGATMAYTTDTDQDGTQLVRMAFSFCHPKDNFNKKLGRIKAYGRLVQFSQQRNLLDYDRFHELVDDDPRRAAEAIAARVGEDYGLQRLGHDDLPF